jgi:small subunit ribosomal protein S19
MARSVWKGPFVHYKLLKKILKALQEKNTSPIVVWSRSSTIIPMCVGLVFHVYNGKKFIPVVVKEQMVGQKFGEYAPTRTFYGHGADKKTRK